MSTHAVDHVRSRTAERPLVAVLIGVTMVTGIISSLGAPLIPSVATSLHVTLDSAQWSLTAALLTACVAAPIMGRLGDGPRRRATIIGGLGIVLIGSVVAGSAGSLAELVVGRAMQGVGLGLAPVTMAAARDLLPAGRAPGVIAILSVSGAAAVGAGYPISGLIDSQLGLHAAFLFGAVTSALALVAVVVVVPRSVARRGAPLDVRGAVVLSAGLVALLLAISQGQRWGWSSAATLGVLLAALVLLAAWIRLQLGHDHPLVDLRRPRHPAVLAANLAAFALGITFYMFLTIVTDFVQEPLSTGYGLGASSLVAGLCLVPFSAISLPASRSMRRLSGRVGTTTILIGGSIVIAAAGAFFALVHTALWGALVAMGGLGLGFGYTFAAIPGMIAQAVPAQETGSAMGLYQVVRYIGFSLGSAVAGAILASDTAPGDHVLERGYIDAMWIAVAICGLSTLMTWIVVRAGRRAGVGSGTGQVAAGSPDRTELAVQEAELAEAGLVGDERP